MLQNQKVAFIGSGAMGEAMIKGLLRQNLIPAEFITAADPHTERGNELAGRYGLHFTTDNLEAVKNADVVVLSIKPQMMNKVLTQLKTHVKPEALIISIAAGVTIERIVDHILHPYVVRAMPNTPGQIGEGITVWTCTPEVNPQQRKWAEAVLGAMGETLFVEDENYLDMATALNGSGPSYVFLLMEALIDVGVHMGFSRQVSQKLVQQTMLGSVSYAIQSGMHPAELRNQVTSPGGTSAAALYELEKGSIRTVIADAVWAAYRRSAELGKNNNK